jgi:hypothetical protein
MTGEAALSIHGVEEKPAAEDGLTDSQRYVSSTWNEYGLQLKKFNYGDSIEIVISENNKIVRIENSPESDSANNQLSLKLIKLSRVDFFQSCLQCFFFPFRSI